MICTPLAASRRTFDAPAPLAGEIAPSSPIRCLRLHATLPARICLLRQLVTDRQRPTVVGLRSAVGRRCSVSVFPSCDTATCSQGRAVREALDPARAQTWRGRGLGGRFDGGRGDLAAQLAAHARLRLVGMCSRSCRLATTSPRKSRARRRLPRGGDPVLCAHALIDSRARRA